MHTTLQRGDIDGVPVFWTQGQPPLSATLVFRVGVRDESFVTAGITHLAEHLVMASLARRRYDFNASTGATYTEFTVTGRPEVVVGHLQDLCGALAAVTAEPQLAERLLTESRVLAAEGGASLPPVAGAMLRSRYGWRGIGLADVDPPALAQIPPSAVLAHAAAHFTRGNAALALTGPPPPGLRMPLPEGPRVPLPPDVPLDLPFPRWHPLGGDALGLSFLLPDDDAPTSQEAALTVLRLALDRAMTDLRHRRGWLYDLDFALEPTHGPTPVTFFADASPEHADDARHELSSVLRDLRDEGPGAAELAEDLQSFVDHLEDPRSAEAAVVTAAMTHLRGGPVLSLAERLPVREALTVQACRNALDLFEGSLLVGLPPGVRPTDVGLVAEPTHSAAAVTGRRHRRSLTGGRSARVPRGAVLVVGDEGLTLELPEGPLTVRWDDVAGLGHDPDQDVWTLVGADGMSVPLAARWFRDGQDAMARVLTAVPEGDRFRT